MSDEWEEERDTPWPDIDVSTGIIVAGSIGVLIWAVIAMALGY